MTADLLEHDESFIESAHYSKIAITSLKVSMRSKQDCI
jgi:hypothetical protein